MNSIENIETIWLTEAPNTFLTPISFTCCSAENIARPNNPRQEINIASAANKTDNLEIMISLVYNF